MYYPQSKIPCWLSAAFRPQNTSGQSGQSEIQLRKKSGDGMCVATLEVQSGNKLRTVMSVMAWGL
jgi:hypothetical protein